MASRTTVRDTPKDAARSPSEGSSPFASKSPFTMCSVRRSSTVTTMSGPAAFLTGAIQASRIAVAGPDAAAGLGFKANPPSPPRLAAGPPAAALEF